MIFDGAMTAFGIVAAGIPACWALLAIAYRPVLLAAWREPVLRVPVLILESDDWGFGPAEQAKRLAEMADLLAAFRDAHGAHPVMTLGVVLAGPDTERMRASNCRSYHRLSLADAPLAQVREAMLAGERRGVFALQLHGMEHYWPDALMRAAQVSEGVRAWLTTTGMPSTESLPPPLQSRWVDASSLPSAPLPAATVIPAAIEEVETFATVFGAVPQVAVPPTFVWTEEVESGWAKAGVSVIVTPGRRYEARDLAGRPVAGAVSCPSGATNADGLIHVVRNDYFEPSLGHTAAKAIDALVQKTRTGRPTLFEIHRINFLGEESKVAQTRAEVRQLLAGASIRFPGLRFMDTATLARHFRGGSELVEDRVAPRLHILLRRLAETARLRKLAWLTGAILPAWIAYRLTMQRG
jgi:hypothetical protein